MRHYRTIWISDTHLGTRGCKADLLLDFLRSTESDKLYLVGDIIDGWRLKKNWYWPQAHSTLVQKVLRKSRKGTEVIFIPGNHDEFLRDFINLEFGSIIIKDHDVHTLIDGRRLLVIHGDIYDVVLHHARWLVTIGDSAYVMALRFNTWLNHWRQRFGLPYWSLSALLKNKVKKAVSIIGDFEQFLVEAARRHGTDGVVCGHIHHAQMKQVGNILYCNDGDWVESCTALVEHYDGTLEILYWAKERENYDLFGYANEDSAD
ncbi:MAG: UDP-2,3-diacylglucosamine diphosphatase [Rickettsiales bacterium]|nr:UDP-2,3-diacylglucosamine diphosphatase [Rickettsiales bacterium]